MSKTLSYCSHQEAKHFSSWCPKNYIIALARKQKVLLPSDLKTLSYCSCQEAKCFASQCPKTLSYCFHQEAKQFPSGCPKMLSYCSHQEAEQFASRCPKHYLIALIRKQNIFLPGVQKIILLLLPGSKRFCFPVI